MSQDQKPEHPLSSQQLTEIAKKVRDISGSAAKNRYEMGRLFATVKAGTSPKQFGAWFHAGQFNLSIRAAHDYVSYASIVDRLAERLSFTVEQVMAKVVCDAAYDLGARALSKAAINELVTVIKAGGRIDMETAIRVLEPERKASGAAADNGGHAVLAVSTIAELLSLSHESLGKRPARILPLVTDQISAAAEAVKTGDMAALERAYVDTVCRLLYGKPYPVRGAESSVQTADAPSTADPLSNGRGKAGSAQISKKTRGHNKNTNNKLNTAPASTESAKEEDLIGDVPKSETISCDLCAEVITMSTESTEKADPVDGELGGMPVSTEQLDETRSTDQIALDPVSEAATSNETAGAPTEQNGENPKNKILNLFSGCRIYDLRFTGQPNPWTGPGPKNAYLRAFYNRLKRKKQLTYDQLEHWCKRNPSVPAPWFLYEHALDAEIGALVPHHSEDEDEPVASAAAG